MPENSGERSSRESFSRGISQANLANVGFGPKSEQTEGSRVLTFRFLDRSVS